MQKEYEWVSMRVTQSLALSHHSSFIVATGIHFLVAFLEGREANEAKMMRGRGRLNHDYEMCIFLCACVWRSDTIECTLGHTYINIEPSLSLTHPHTDTRTDSHSHPFYWPRHFNIRNVYRSSLFACVKKRKRRSVGSIETPPQKRGMRSKSL